LRYEHGIYIYGSVFTSLEDICNQQRTAWSVKKMFST